MVHLETVEELAESLADAVGVYGCLPDDTGFGNHPVDCKCRICFVSDITDRIQHAVKNDVFLANMKQIEACTYGVEYCKFTGTHGTHETILKECKKHNNECVKLYPCVFFIVYSQEIK